MKKLLVLIGCFLSFTCFAASAENIITSGSCPIADKTSPQFCSQFTVAAHCNCRALFPGKPPAFCDTIPVSELKKMMMAGFHDDLDAACKFQEKRTGVAAALCVEHWKIWDAKKCVG
jgi:hypothetical protein